MLDVRGVQGRTVDRYGRFGNTGVMGTQIIVDWWGVREGLDPDNPWSCALLWKATGVVTISRELLETQFVLETVAGVPLV